MMSVGDRQHPQELHDLREDFEAFRRSVTERLDLLEDEARPEVKAELRRIRMNLEIEDFRNGRL